jgi:glutamate synthase domain-containing protein 3
MGLGDEFQERKGRYTVGNGVDRYRRTAEPEPYLFEIEELADICEQVNERRTVSEDYYAMAEDLLSGKELSEELVYEFCEQYEFEGDEMAEGITVTAMIDRLDADTVVLPDMKDVPYIGYDTDRDIVIEGDVGDWAGYVLDGGSLLVEGDAGEYVAHQMRAGGVRVHGDAGESAGSSMMGGTLIIKGDAGEFLGSSMRGGEIDVHGDAGDRCANAIRGGVIEVDGAVDGGLGDPISGGEIYLGEEVPLHEFVVGGEIFVKRDDGFEQIYPGDTDRTW